MSDLTKDEAAWLKKLNKLLANPPSDRLGFYTVGDPSVEVYDTTFQQNIDELMESRNKDFCTAVGMFDAELGTIKFPSHVHSTAG